MYLNLIFWISSILFYKTHLYSVIYAQENELAHENIAVITQNQHNGLSKQKETSKYYRNRFSIVVIYMKLERGRAHVSKTIGKLIFRTQS